MTRSIEANAVGGWYVYLTAPTVGRPTASGWTAAAPGLPKITIYTSVVVAKLTDDPAMILKPLDTCARVPSAAVHTSVRKLRDKFTAPPPPKENPPPAPSPASR